MCTNKNAEALGALKSIRLLLFCNKTKILIIYNTGYLFPGKT